MTKLVNRAKMSVSGTPGTGSVTLLAAVTGFQTFANAGLVNGDSVSYVIEDGTNWELGTGTYNSTGPVLARTSITASSNSGSAVSFSSAALVYIAPLANDLQSGTVAGNLVRLDGSAKLPAVDGSALTNIVASSLAATLNVAGGGTGTTSFTANRILYGNGTSALQVASGLWWNNASGYLGVNVASSPAANLDVDTVDGHFLVGIGGSSNIAIDSDITVFRGVNSGGNVERGRWHSNGYFGINTNAPTKQLDVSGQFRVHNNEVFGKSDETSFVRIWGGDATSNAAWMRVSGHSNSNGFSDTITFGTLGTERVRIADTLMVGTTTTLGAMATIAYGNIVQFMTNNFGTLHLHSTTGTSNGLACGGSLTFGGDTSNVGVPRAVFAGIAGRKTNSTSGDLSGYLATYVNNGSQLVETGRVTTNGESQFWFPVRITTSDGLGASGYPNMLILKNDNGSATNIQKTIRMSGTGSLQIVNNAFTAVIQDLTDAGDLTVSGAITGRATYAKLYLAANATVTSGTDLYVGLTAGLDPQSGWNGSTKRWTAAVTGTYLVTWQAHLQGVTPSGSNQWNTQIRKTGSTVGISQSIQLSDPGTTITCTVLIQMTGGTDYLEFSAYSAGSNATLVGDSPGTWTYATIVRVN